MIVDQDRHLSSSIHQCLSFKSKKVTLYLLKTSQNLSEDAPSSFHTKKKQKDKKIEQNNAKIEEKIRYY